MVDYEIDSDIEWYNNIDEEEGESIDSFIDDDEENVDNSEHESDKVKLTLILKDWLQDKVFSDEEDKPSNKIFNFYRLKKKSI